MRAVLYVSLLANLASLVVSKADQDAHSDVVHVTVTRTQYTCPCDSSTSYTTAGHSHQKPGTVSVSTSTAGPDHPSPPSDSTQCYSYMTSDSVPSAPTIWSTSYLPCTSTITSSITTTSTLPPDTSTITTTDTTTSTAPTTVYTDTSTETDTETSTITTTSTQTLTSIVTVDTSTSTTTVATLAGFLPVQDSLPGATYDGSGGPDPVNKRDIHGSSNAKQNALPGLHSNVASVLCMLTTSSSTCSSTVTTSTSTTTVSAPTVSTTLTSTVTTTVVPSATTTVTTTTTSTSTTTTTVNTATTTTTTTYLETTTTTLYAACATNNIANLYNGQGFLGGAYQGSDDYSQAYVSANSAYDCCVATQNYPGGAGQMYFWGVDSTDCYVEYSPGVAVGAEPQSDNTWQMLLGTSDYIVGNGPNGEINSVSS